MISLKNKTVFITGASAGIGKACAKAFAAEGANLVISARRVDRINNLAEELKKNHGVNVYAFKLDVRERDNVLKSVAKLPEEFKNIDILINNAGLARGLVEMYKDDPTGWDEMIDTNLKGALNVIHAIVPGMVERKSGHVINIGSTAGHLAYPKGGVYCATKFALSAITDSLRMDVIDKGIRVGTIDPGMVETDFSGIRFRGDMEKAKAVYRGVDPLTAADIAEAVIFMASRPANVNIGEIILLAGTQANAFVVHRDPNINQYK